MPGRCFSWKAVPYAVLLDALDRSMVRAPKKSLSARKSSISHDVMKSGRSSACVSSLSAV